MVLPRTRDGPVGSRSRSRSRRRARPCYRARTRSTYNFRTSADAGGLHGSTLHPLRTSSISAAATGFIRPSQRLTPAARTTIRFVGHVARDRRCGDRRQSSWERAAKGPSREPAFAGRPQPLRPRRLGSHRGALDAQPIVPQVVGGATTRPAPSGCATRSCTKPWPPTSPRSHCSLQASVPTGRLCHPRSWQVGA
jgi:hypothetical protein